ncbi:MAG: hypothetical protein WCA46_25220 [Actinocatenispora sp.]
MTEQNRTHHAGPRHRLRRAAAVLAMSAVVAAGATACQVQPGAAAFVDNQRFTQTQVETIFDSIRDGYKGKLPSSQFANVRQAVTKDLVMRDLAKRVAEQKHLKVSPPDYKEISQQSGLPQDNRYVRLEAQTRSYVNAIRNGASPKKPSESDVREIYRSLVRSGVDPRRLPFDALRKGLPPGTGKAVAARDELLDAAHKYHVDVNPRYGKLDYSLTAVSFQDPSSGQMLVGSLTVPLGGGSPDVVHTAPAENPLQG